MGPVDAGGLLLGLEDRPVVEMRRREVINLLGGAAVASPFSARAQPTNVHRIAIVRTSGSVADLSEAGNPGIAALFKEVRRLGYVEGRNLIVERYSGEGRQERYTELAREVVRTKPTFEQDRAHAVMVRVNGRGDVPAKEHVSVGAYSPTHAISGGGRYLDPPEGNRRQ
jgi:hypothetical protein